MKEIQRQLFEKIKDTGWDDKLRFFGEFEEILEFLQQGVAEGRRFTPGIKSWFMPFELCPLDCVKVVFLVPEPYLDPTHNNGLALSCNKSLRPPIEFFRFLEQFQAEFPKLICSEELLNGDISTWALQGILMINESITTQVQKSGRHTKLWAGFYNYVCDILNRKEDLIWVSFGETGGWEDINENHLKLKLNELPQDRDQKFSTEGIFGKINEYLVSKNISPVIW